MDFAQRTQTLRPEGAYEVLARAQALEAHGHHIIHLEIGEPDFDTPANIGQAAAEAIRAGRTRYNPSAGIAPLREVIAQDAGRRRGIAVRPSQVVVGPGAKPSLFFPTLALVNPGDEVIYPDPGFPTYRMMIDVAGGVPVAVPLLESNAFSFDLEAFDRALSPRTRMIVLNSPGNPTGGVIPMHDLEHIAAAALKNNLWVLADEIYSRIVFDGLHVPSIMTIDGMQERTILLDGFSKTYAMTGWRLGYGIMPEPLAEKVSLLLNHSVGCTAMFTQVAGIEAITGPQEPAEAMVAEFARRRSVIVDGLNRLPGFRCRMPEGTFYAFPNIEGTGIACEDLANRFLEGGVALLPGTAFGRHGAGFLRLSFANSTENILEALRRMEKVLRAA
jgi:aspartate/methionine/tyrosine aminotransferase